MSFKTSRRAINQPPLTLNGSRIEYKTSHKLLGITLDSNYTFSAHIENIKSKALKSLNCIKILSSKRHGVNRNILARIYKACIRPIFDYGSTIYDTAAETNLNKIEVVQNAALRIISGALRTSPVISLRVDSGIPSLANRRKSLLGTYICRIKENPQNPGYNAIFHNPHNLQSEHFIRKRKPSNIRFREYFDNIDIDLLNLIPLKESIPPWTLSLPKTQFLITEKKNNISSTEIQTKFFKLSNELGNSELFFCDGSKSLQHCGCAFVHETEVNSFKLHCYTSSYSAEIIALYKCLEHIIKNGIASTVIFTDSKSLLLAIQKRNTSNPLVKNIQENAHRANLNNLNIQIVWIPGHSGISGNELADAGAKNANATSSCNIIFAEDLKHIIKRTCVTNWTNEWMQSNKHLRNIKTDTQYWESSNRKKRTEEVILARLRIGHTRLSHSYLINREPRPICDLCQVPICIDHILITCPKYNNERQKNLLHLTSINSILANDKKSIDAVFRFLYHTKIFQTL